MGVASLVAIGSPRSGWVCAQFDKGESCSGRHRSQKLVVDNANVNMPGLTSSPFPSSSSSHEAHPETHEQVKQALVESIAEHQASFDQLAVGEMCHTGIASVSKTGEDVVWASKEDCYLGICLSSATGNVVLASVVAQKLLDTICDHFTEKGFIPSKKLPGKGQRGKKGRFQLKAQPNHSNSNSLSDQALKHCDETLGLIHLLVPGGVLTRIDKAISKSIQRQWSALFVGN